MNEPSNRTPYPRRVMAYMITPQLIHSAVCGRRQKIHSAVCGRRQNLVVDMPEDAVFVSSNWDPIKGCYLMVFEHETFPPCYEGEQIMIADHHIEYEGDT